MKSTRFNLFFPPALCQRESIANSAPSASRETAVANALDPLDGIDFSESADGWFKISPYGIFRGKTPGRPQTVTADNAASMVSEFNSLLGKLGRTFRGVPIYHGHPDVDPEIWPDDRRIGKITQLQARADGLWGLAEWNSTGAENKAEGWWVYPSPRWDAPAGSSSFTPDRLISVGLTNTPRITESEPVFNSHLTKKIETDTTMDLTLLRQKLGLAPEATDEEILVKIESLAAAAAEEETPDPALEAANAAATAAVVKKDELACSLAANQAALASARAEHNTALLDLAARDGRITPAERPVWAARLASASREQEINALTALRPQLNTRPLQRVDRHGERSAADGLREQVANAVTALEATGLPYHEAWLRTKRDPKFSEYFTKSNY